MAEASRGLLDPRVHALQRRLDARERLREEADDVREHEQRKRLVERRQVVRGEEHERARSRSRAARCRCTRAARACVSSERVALGEERDGEHRDDRDHRGERGNGDGRERRLPRDVDPVAELEPAHRPVDEHRQRDDEEKPNGGPRGRRRPAATTCRRDRLRRRRTARSPTHAPDAEAAPRARAAPSRTRRARAPGPRQAFGRRAGGTAGRSTGSARCTA